MSSDADRKGGMTDDSVYLAGITGCWKGKMEEQHTLVKAIFSQKGEVNIHLWGWKSKFVYILFILQLFL
jgi:hypothetical protein